MIRSKHLGGGQGRKTPLAMGVAVALVVALSTSPRGRAAAVGTQIPGGSGAPNHALEEVIADHHSPRIGMSDVLIADLGDERDAQIAVAGGLGIGSSRTSCSGSKEQAQRAFRGQWMESDDGEVWLLQGVAEGARAREIGRIVPPRGAELWASANIVVAVTCGGD